jgi:hypothetical protein
MEVNSDHFEIIEKIDGEVKTEPHDEMEINKTWKIINSEPVQLIGEKRKNKEKLISESKKIKEEFVVLFEESDYKQELQETEELNLDDVNNQVTNIW